MSPDELFLKFWRLNTPNQAQRKTFYITRNIWKSWSKFGHFCFICGFTAGNYFCFTMAFFWPWRLRYNDLSLYNVYLILQWNTQYPLGLFRQIL